MDKQSNLSTSLTRKPSERLLQEVTREVTNRTGHNSGNVSAVVNGYYAQVRHAENAFARLLILLGELSKAYGGREIITDYVLDQCATLVWNDFRSSALTK